MRLVFALVGLSLLFAVAGCKAKPAANAVTRRQCVELVRKERRLRSANTAGLGMAEQVGERADVDACMGKATQTAYRCVMHAESAADLGACDELMK